MNILLIEDESSTARAIELILTTEGFDVFSTSQGEEGMDLVKLYDYDIILLDLNLPDMQGYEVLRKLRAAKVHTPVLVLSGISDPDATVACLCYGADDYVTKPFHSKELVCRINAIIQRAKKHAPSLIRNGKLTVNLDARIAEYDGILIPLTGKEYHLLELLAIRKGMTLTKDMLLTQLYDGMDEPEPKIIDVFICNLRKKMAQSCGGNSFIETVWGRGYKMGEPGKCQLAA